MLNILLVIVMWLCVLAQVMLFSASPSIVVFSMFCITFACAAYVTISVIVDG